jgi:hypothetical protein
MKRLLVVVGLVLALEARAQADEEAAIKAIEKLGGQVYRDEKQPGKPVTQVDLNGTKVTDAGLKHLKELKELRSLDLSGTQVRDAGLKELKELKELRSLDLSDTEVRDAGLKELKELKELRKLNLYSTKVTDAGVAELQQALPNCKITR